MIKNWITELLYRKKSIAIILNDKNDFLVDQLVSYGENDLNFSGGGIEKGETEEQGLLRELQEELGTNKFKIVFKSKNLVSYNWPLKVIIQRILKKHQLYLGQSQRQFIVKFVGANSDKSLLLDIEFKTLKQKYLIDKQKTYKQLKKLDSNVNVWLDFVFDTFNFALNARKL